MLGMFWRKTQMSRQKEWEQQLERSLQNAISKGPGSPLYVDANAMHGGVISGGASDHPSAYSKPSPNFMLAARFRVPHLNQIPGFSYLSVHELPGSDQTVVFYVRARDNAPGYLTDPCSLFPSDALVTKIRLLNEA